MPSPPQTRFQKIRRQLGKLFDTSVSASLKRHPTRTVPRVPCRAEPLPASHCWGLSSLAGQSLFQPATAESLCSSLLSAVLLDLCVLGLIFSLASSFLALLWPQRQDDTGRLLPELLRPQRQDDTDCLRSFLCSAVTDFSMQCAESVCCHLLRHRS